LDRLGLAIERWSRKRPEEVITRWRELSDTIGRRVRVQLPGRVVEGTAQDVDAAGNLVVDGELVSAGSVTVLGDREQRRELGQHLT